MQDRLNNAPSEKTLDDNEEDDQKLGWQERDYRKSMRRSSAVTGGSGAKSFSALKLKTMAMIRKQTAKKTASNGTQQRSSLSNTINESKVDKLGVE